MSIEKNLENLRNQENRLVSEELSKSGINISDIYELVKLDVPDIGVPVLLSLMRRVTHPAIKQGVIRALAVDLYRDLIGPDIVNYFENIEDTEWAFEDTKWILGNTLEIIANENLFDDISRIAVDSRHGKGRQMVVLALAKLKNDQSVDVLMGLIDDSDVGGHAVIALRKIGDRRAVKAIEQKLTDKNPWIRAEARKALKKINAI